MRYLEKPVEYFIPYENISSVLVERILPKLQTVRLVAERDSTLDTERAVSIYEILELLVADGRLRRINLLGDVICLDVHSSRPEIPVMIALGSKSLIAAEGLHIIDKGIFTETTYLDLYAVNALRKCQPN